MKKYALFGAGGGGREALKTIGKEKIAYFIDSKAAGNIEGIPVYDPEYLRHNKHNETIVITPKNFRFINEITILLESMGIKDYLLFSEVKELLQKEIKSNNVSDQNLLGNDVVCSKTMINLGSGSWKCPGWINLDYSTECYAKLHNGVVYKEYDIRHDEIPYQDNTVDCIYCSHVIEHIENQYVEHMMEECYRVMRKGGVLRIACPDAEFLYKMTKLGKDWWEWRKTDYEKWKIDWENLRPIDLLVREIATKRLLDYLKNDSIFDYEQAYNNMDMNSFFHYITDGLEYNKQVAGRHINYWEFEKARKYLTRAGFETVIKSQYASSVSPYMQNRKYFDLTYPMMSLYVDAIK